jgi:hypothetical protein
MISMSASAAAAARLRGWPCKHSNANLRTN